MPSLTVVVPTYNRAALLRSTLLSLLRAIRPAGLDISILVVDNNSRDDTPAVVREIAQAASLPIHYLLETRQSSSFTRNAGVLACTTDLLGFVDDDEEVEEHWFEVVLREFTDPELQFLGGPYYSGSNLTLPDWLPPDYPAVIGVQQPRPRGIFGSTFHGNLNGGNSVFRRAVFDMVGLYSTDLGRSGKGLLCEEDAELYSRVLALGLRGVFTPDLIIFHHIPPDRLTPRYHRRWCFWRGVSQGLLARKAPLEPVPHLLGVPRYRLAQALQSLTDLSARRRGKSPAQRLNAELLLWDLTGFLYGRYLVRIQRFYQPVRTN